MSWFHNSATKWALYKYFFFHHLYIAACKYLKLFFSWPAYIFKTGKKTPHLRWIKLTKIIIFIIAEGFSSYAQAYCLLFFLYLSKAYFWQQICLNFSVSLLSFFITKDSAMEAGCLSASMPLLLLSHWKSQPCFQNNHFHKKARQEVRQAGQEDLKMPTVSSFTSSSSRPRPASQLQLWLPMAEIKVEAI